MYAAPCKPLLFSNWQSKIEATLFKEIARGLKGDLMSLKMHLWKTACEDDTSINCFFETMFANLEFAINIALYFILIYEEQSLIPSSSNAELIMLTFDFVSSVDFKLIRKIRLNLDLINWAKINPKPSVTINCGHSGRTNCCPSCSTLKFTIWNSVWALLRHAPFIMLCNKLFFIKSLIRIANESIIDTVLRYINSDTVELVICTIKLGAPFLTLTIPILRNQMFSTRIVKCLEFIRVPLTSSSKRCILRRGVFALIVGCPLIPVKVIFSNTWDGSTIV